MSFSKHPKFNWYSIIDGFMREQGSTRSDVDNNVLYSKENNKINCHECIVIYVDDLLITGNDKNNIEWVKQQLADSFWDVTTGNYGLLP